MKKRRYPKKNWSAKQRLRFFSAACPYTGCWLWNGSTVDGYGCLGWQGKSYKAHRLSYSVFVETIPKGLYVLHSCHQRACINPTHLRLGTQKENMEDMVAAGRQHRPCGELHGLHKLTANDVLEIREKYARSENERPSQRSLARQYGVSQRLIWNIVSLTAWTHLAPHEASQNCA